MSQSKGPESQSKAIKLLPEQTESNGPESQIVGPKLDIEDHEEVSGMNSKSKVPMLEIYVKRNHALN